MFSDPSGRLNFAGKAVLHGFGVDFSNGSSFVINMDQLVLQHELGRGNYGTVKKVLHKPTNVEMAMKVSSHPVSVRLSLRWSLKEIRLELDTTRLNGILMELDILHRAISPCIVEFYGAFFVESCVYYCMEYMDGGSLASLCCFPNGNVSLPPSISSSPGSAWTSNPAPILDEHLARIASSMTRGLAFLKDNLGVMHRDVKPTNVLVNCRGQVKLCDFGVSGQLEKSIARTNVGCQSYMAVSSLSCSNPWPNLTLSSRRESRGLRRQTALTTHLPHTPSALTSGPLVFPSWRLRRESESAFLTAVCHRLYAFDCSFEIFTHPLSQVPLSSGNLRERVCTAQRHRRRRSTWTPG